MKRELLVLLSAVVVIVGLAHCIQPAPPPTPNLTSVNPVATDLLISGQTTGDNLYFNGTHWLRRASGTTTGSPVSFGACASRPSAAGTNLLYYCNDLPVTYFDDPNGSVWRQFVAGQYMPAPAAAGSYTVSANAVLANVADVITAAPTVNAASKAYWALINASGTLGTTTNTWIVNAWMTINSTYITGFGEVGPCVTNGTTTGTSTGRSVSVGIGSTGFGSQGKSFTLDGTDSGLGTFAAAASNLFPGGMLARARLLNDGTNLHYQLSPDGHYWTPLFCEASISGLTSYGFFFGDPAAGTNTAALVTMYRNDLTTLTVAQASINGATNASPIVISTTAAHNFNSGDIVAIHAVGGNTNANSGTLVTNPGASSWGWPIKVTDSTHFQLVGSTGNANYTSGGTATLVSR